MNDIRFHRSVITIAVASYLFALTSCATPISGAPHSDDGGPASMTNWDESDYSKILDQDYEPSEGDSLWAINQLMALPTVEVVAVDYHGFAEDIQTAIELEFGPTDWEVTEPQISPSTACLGIYQYLAGRSVDVSLVSKSRTFSGDEWPRAVDVVAQTAGRYGFIVEERIAEGVENYALSLYGPRGGRVGIFSNTSFIVNLSSECYLTESSKESVRSVGVPDVEGWGFQYPESSLLP